MSFASEPELSPRHVATLRELARMGGLISSLRLSSRELARNLGLSQQTASRQLQELERADLVSRTLTPRGQVISLTSRGREVLEAEYSIYRELFEAPPHLVVEGSVETGLGEGSYYITLPGYTAQFKDRLGFSPYPGTLNLRPAESMRSAVERLRASSGVKINGFTAEGRSFGGATCHLATLFRSDRIEESALGAMIIPHRTHYRRVIEIISPWFLREKLDLSDGDQVTMEVELEVALESGGDATPP